MFNCKAEEFADHNDWCCYQYHPEGACQYQLACDEPGCKKEVTSGTPTPTGYRRTCSKHAPRLQHE